MSKFRRLLAGLEVDRAVVFSVLTSFWRVAAGLVSMVLIARFFPPEIQGFYYTFWSLLALQSFVEPLIHQQDVRVDTRRH